MKATFLKFLGLVVLLGCLGVIRAQADTLIASQDNFYSFGVVIHSSVYDQGANYLWKYRVDNHGYDPHPGSSNGFSGFELALPVFPPDLGNPTAPSLGWIDNCCSGRPWEWDIPNSNGPGIMPGQSGDFSFTTLPRFITTATDGWFHTWENNVQDQATVVFYGVSNAPLAPDVERPALPEPGTLWLLGIGGLAFVSCLRKKAQS